MFTCRAREWVVKEFDLAHGGRLSLFETIIRIVGGLIAAFDASGDLLFLQKAQELAQKLHPNFPGGGKGMVSAQLPDTINPCAISSRRGAVPPQQRSVPLPDLPACLQYLYSLCASLARPTLTCPQDPGFHV